MRVRGSVLMFVGVFFSLISGGCSSGDPNGTIRSVQVLDNAFSPATLTIPVGTTVSWSWAGFVDHNVLFNPSTGIPSSEIQKVGGFDVQFTTPGTYPYNCSLHSGMNGTIIVQ